jgi:flavin-binding protein dodecin
MCASKADRPVSLVANSEDQAISGAVDKAVSAISRFAVIETIVRENGKVLEIESSERAICHASTD